MADRILLVEDEDSLADSVRYNLEREGYAVAVAVRRPAGLDRFRDGPPSLVILDLMLPRCRGSTCAEDPCRSDVPIIMVTAKDSEADKVTGLELGADDYVTKPFSVREFVSRVRANLRRTRTRADARRKTSWAEDRSRWMSLATKFGVRDEAVAFPPKEFELLELFLRGRDACSRATS